MCCFSRAVRHVSSTSIFARMASPGRQLLAYSMSVEASEELAMILPLPVPPGCGEDAVRFIDLSGYPRFFRDLDEAFPSIVLPPKSRGLFEGLDLEAKLEVHQVGDFEASFVPTMADLARLDPRFQIDEGVWRKQPQYADYGFAVFKLRGFGAGLLGRVAHRAVRRDFHPMALEFPTRARDVFFPTVHIHDGEMHPSALFDHALYTQSTGRPATLSLEPDFAVASSSWQQGWGVDEAVRVDATAGLVTPGGRLFRHGLHGTLANTDRWASVAG